MKAKFIALAALVLGLASCQQDFDAPVQMNGEVDFQLSVAANEITRGIDLDGDDKKGYDSAHGAIDYLSEADWAEVDLRYSLEVYDKVDDYAGKSPIKDRQVIIVDKYEPVKFDLRLIPNREYHFVVFADFVQEGATVEVEEKTMLEHQSNLGLHHTIGANLGEITIKADGINDECTDAYFATKDIKITNSASQDITLKRPYGKVRVIATDLAELNLNVNPKFVHVVYTAAHPAAFNAVTGAISAKYETAQYKYEYANITKESLANHVYTAGYDAKKATNANGVERHTHMTLFTDYILAEDQHAPIQFTMTVYDQDASPIKETIFSTDIPVKRNMLTTIIGNVLTTATDITVTIDDNFADEYTYAEDIDTTPLFLSLLEEASNSVEATIDLSGDVVWATGASHGSTPLMGENAKTQVLTINGNGNTFTATGKGIGAIRMANGGKVIFNNVKFVDESVSYAENSWEHGYLEFAGNLEFNNCEFVNAIMVCGETANNKSAGNATFYNCSFNSHDNNQYGVWVSGNRAYFNECTFEGPRGLKVHEDYGSEVEKVVVDTTTFQNITKKPGIALGTLNADTTIVICNSTFNNCQAGDQGLYIYETDTDVNSFTFTEKDNTVCVNVATAEELKNAIAAVNGNVIVDAKGAELNFNATFTTAMVPAGKTATIRNANVTGRSYGNKVNGDVVFEDCSFNNANGAYSIHFDGGKGNVFFKNCALFGWNSFGTLNSISLEDCTLKGNGTYALLRSYTALSLTNCVVDITNANHEDEWPEGVEAIEGGTLTETNVKYVAGNEAALKAAVSKAGATVNVMAGEYTFPSSSIAEGVTIVCEEGTVFTGNSKLNIKGATVVGATFSNPSGTAVDQTINGTFKNCTFTGSNALRWCYAGETVVFEDCVFSGNVYGIHFDGGANEATFRNCTISGFNAFAGAMTMVNFEGCTFVGNGKSGYNGANLWGSATLKECEFTFDGTTSNEWIDCIKADGTYSFENCTVNGVKYTHENYTSYSDIFSRNDAKVKINGVERQL